MSVLYIANKLTITNAPEELFQWCRKNLEFPNPEYAKAEQAGRWTGNIEPIIVLWEKRGNDCILPYGCLESIRWNFAFDNIITKKRAEYSIDYKSHIQLYDYQQLALDSVTCGVTKSGVIVMPCGSGKTQTALAIVASLGKRALWITHTHELLQQSKDRALSCFGIESSKIGTISNGKINVGEYLTFATVQTLANIDLSPYEDYWDVVIVDECHKAVGTPTKLMMFYKAVSQLNAPCKIGLTATPKRNDGLERCMYALLGPQICNIPDKAVEHNTVPIYVYQDKSKFLDNKLKSEYDFVSYLNPDGTINYNRLLDFLCECKERNEHIAKWVNDINSTGCTCLVLSDRVEHLKTLRQLVGLGYTMQIFSQSGSIKAREARKDCIEQLRSKQIRCLFATYQLAKEGLDIPSLDCVVFATPKKDAITVIQSCGRVGRKSPGKQSGLVLDIVDEDVSIFEGYARKRKNFYKTKNYKILNSLKIY